MSFQIIAIKPIKGCHKKYLKLLNENSIYYLYREFTIDENNDRISFEKKIPEQLYDVECLNNEKVKICISAISGKNGSGKSTLIELLFLAINNFSFRLNKKNRKADLIYVDDVRVEFYFKTFSIQRNKGVEKFYKVKVFDDEVTIHRYRKVKGNFELYQPAISDDIYKLQDFFYTVTINHSHYAYNTDDLGDWLNGLFHKNDAYQTPLVLNPMRTRGDFKISTENHLVKSRLISNLVKPTTKFNFKKLTDNLEAIELDITLNDTKREKIIYELPTDDPNLNEKIKLKDLNLNEDLIYKKINKYYKFSYDSNNKKKLRIALDYLKYKLVNICVTYSDYDKYFSTNNKKFNEELLDEYFKELFVNDESHITFKLKQTLNYIRFSNNNIPIKKQRVPLKKISDFISKIKENKNYSKINAIELIPPPFFNTDIILNSEKNEKIEFKTLSSGEKQKIYSISSILYHLSNLDSVKNTRTKTAYTNVNIILEEIELYFHPEMQRNFINDILNSISGIELNKIKAINFCFVSHSPFILSDIPKENIMFLENIDNKATQILKDKSTFGANIHDLLKDGFFMNKGSIGEFAKKRITETIQWMNSIHEEKEKRFKEDFELLVKDKEYHKNIIEIIDEPIIKSKLLEMYSEIFGNEERKKHLKYEIDRLNKELKALQ
ncbi:AAA family ATPase [Flavobacterium luminosum]|uniref:ATP-binding protein n=1 Tax=Flavobacterium luminosum TaxID=2949086 RepID=A0ABT0TR73_9FLAO|nr:AAA family ATPase [Flavobacterium sp. HXWNR70]MCL9809996.1 ATP-binding protein [Flavobacterium sp. HXWNR70]